MLTIFSLVSTNMKKSDYLFSVRSNLYVQNQLPIY